MPAAGHCNRSPIGPRSHHAVSVAAALSMRRRLIRNIDWIVTVDGSRRMIADGAIAINGDRIAAIGKSSAVEREFAADEIIDGRGLIAMPGLIDTCVASVHQLGRGV